MPPAALLAYIVPLLIQVIEHLSPGEAEEVRQKLDEAVARRRAAVARNEALDAPREGGGGHL